MASIISEASFQQQLDNFMLDCAAESLASGDRRNAYLDLRTIAAVRPNADDIINSYDADLSKFYTAEKDLSDSSTR